jgi:hypothetical protein
MNLPDRFKNKLVAFGARRIDFSKPLTEADKRFLVDAGYGAPETAAQKETPATAVKTAKPTE